MNELKRFWNEEDGLATLEIVLIIVVLVGLAVMFKDGITEIVKNILDNTIIPKTEQFQ